MFTPKASAVDIINTAATKWRKMGITVKNLIWRHVTNDINIVLIFGAFESLFPIIIDKEMNMSLGHYDLISTTSNML